MPNSQVQEPSAEALEKALYLQWLLSHPNYQGAGNRAWSNAIALALDARAVAGERERCAQIADARAASLFDKAGNRHDRDDYDGFEQFDEAASLASAIASAIRGLPNRGEQG